MKKWLFYFLLSFSINAYAINVDDITYEWLVNEGYRAGYTDHIVHFEKIFSERDVKIFLEFGLGYSTKYFLDNCTKVISVEVITHGCGPAWMKECLQLYSGYANWVPISFFSGYQGDTGWAPFKYIASESVYKADAHQGATHSNYALIDPTYIDELNTFIKNLTKYNKIDVAFVDSSSLLRGDFVQLLFGKVDIILAHDFSPGYTGDDVYGYSRVKHPKSYVAIHLPKGKTMLWIANKEKNASFIEEMQRYAASL